jgi:hypothetical protein
MTVSAPRFLALAWQLLNQKGCASRIAMTKYCARVMSRKDNLSVRRRRKRGFNHLSRFAFRPHATGMTPPARKIVAHTNTDVELLSDSFQSGECCNYQSQETEESFYRSCNAPDLLFSGPQCLDSFPGAARRRYRPSDTYLRTAAICANSNLQFQKFHPGMNPYMLYPID